MRAIACALALALAAGCAGGFATGRRDDAIAEAFARHEVLPGFRYYVHPFPGQPDAILGIRRDFTLEGGLWHEVAMTPALLRGYGEDLGVDRGGALGVPPARAIVAPGGEVVGFWHGDPPVPPSRVREGRRIAVPLPVPAAVREGRSPAGVLLR